MTGPGFGVARAAGGAGVGAVGCGATGAGAGAELVGARTTCLQCGQRTCRPRNSAVTPMRRPQNGQGKVIVGEAMCRVAKRVSGRRAGRARGGQREWYT